MTLLSWKFLGFFAAVFAVYYLLHGRQKWQNALLLAASVLFYGMMDLRMLPMLVVMTLLFYGAGVWIWNLRRRGATSAAAWLTRATVVVGLLPLLYFKYYGFFYGEICSMLGRESVSLGLLLPLGISFFTFRLLSYVIEVNRGTLEPTRDIVAFGVYVMFFPALMAGPIDRPQHLLPQLAVGREADYSILVDGLKRFVWGCFMKVCVADQLFVFVDVVFAQYSEWSGGMVTLAALLYPLQLYADFAGYSHMAIGLSRMLGLKVAENFSRPFFAQNVAEYWRRWHMSLTSWLTDYVFIPLNLSFRNLDRWGTVLACVLNFLLVGFWHGANWTYGLFGLYYALLFVPLILQGRMNKKNKFKWRHGWLLPPAVVLRIVGTYLLIVVGQIIFRSVSVPDAFGFMAQVMQDGKTELPPYITHSLVAGLLCLVVVVVNDWMEECRGGKTCEGLLRIERPVAVVLLVVLLVAVTLFLGSSTTQVFIYQKF
jgi:D-alanyl-lipoteichoic acid acyltransferase DltB (MBOAT superfamily)